MKRNLALTRIPDHPELRRAYERFSRASRQAVCAFVLQNLELDLAAALSSDDPDTLSAKERRAVGQAMYDRGAAFMVSSSSAPA